VLDPFSLLMLAQGAVSAIRTGCDMLREGKAVIDEFKGETESIVGEVKATVEDLRGLWDWARGLWEQIAGAFGIVPSKPPTVETALPTAPIVEAPKPVAKKKSKTSQRELTYEEYKAKAIHDVCEQLKVFFEVQRQLKQHCRELEEQSLTTERIADSAIDRIEIETQLINLSTQIREAMSWTPEDLGLQDMYKRFLKMYDLILEEQEFERQRKLMNARKKRWQQEARRNFRIDLVMWAVAMSVVLSVWWWMMVQVVTLTGYYTE